jgi:hypothetical protein
MLDLVEGVLVEFCERGAGSQRELLTAIEVDIRKRRSAQAVDRDRQHRANLKACGRKRIRNLAAENKARNARRRVQKLQGKVRRGHE